MKGVVIVPTWRRPDHLWATLHRIFMADGWQQYRYLVSIDRDPDPECREVAESFFRVRGPECAGVDIVQREPHGYHGNSFNLLSAYAWAVERCGDMDLVYLIEEDISVARGFFRFHEAAHEFDSSCFAVSACRDQNHSMPPVDPHDAQARSMVHERDTYQSLGVSFHAEVLRDEILPLATRGYFTSPVETLAAAYPNTRIARGQAEQDGLINRVLEERCRREGHGMFYPLVPRAAHLGWHGYNRLGGKPLQTGTLPEIRGRQILAMTDAEMNALADPSFRDITRCELDVADADPLVLRRMVV